MALAAMARLFGVSGKNVLTFSPVQAALSIHSAFTG
jgi:hypothetical protein